MESHPSSSHPQRFTNINQLHHLDTLTPVVSTKQTVNTCFFAKYSLLLFYAYIDKNCKDVFEKLTRIEQPKRPYSIASFKKLLPQVHTTRNFRKTKRWILQELQTKFRNKAIRNHSSHQLSPIETEVLALGLNFVPTPLPPHTTSS